MSPYTRGHGGQHKTIPNTVFSILLDIASGIRGGRDFVLFCMNQPVHDRITGAVSGKSVENIN